MKRTRLRSRTRLKVRTALRRKKAMPRARKPMPKKRARPRKKGPPGKRDYPGGVRRWLDAEDRVIREECLATREGIAEYHRRRLAMCVRQEWMCAAPGCPHPDVPMIEAPGTWYSATFDHEDGRGMGGSRTNDMIEIDGRPYNRAVHHSCNVRLGSPNRKAKLQ